MHQWMNPQKDEMQSTSNLLLLMIHLLQRRKKKIGSGLLKRICMVFKSNGV